MVETWEGFSTAIREHFANPHEIMEDLAKMDKLVCANNINDYIIKMDTPNYRIGFSGVSWHHMPKMGLPSKIGDRMTYGAMEPSDTTEFIERPRSAGRRYEQKHHHHHPLKNAFRSSKTGVSTATLVGTPASSSRSLRASETPRCGKTVEKSTATSSEKPEWRDRDE